MDEGRLFHSVPRVDADDRIFLLPLPLAKWLTAGAFSGPIAATLTSWTTGMPQADAWSLPIVWLAWASGLVVALLGAFVRPGGLHALAWGVVWSDHVLAPQRAVWRPISMANKE